MTNKGMEIEPTAVGKSLLVAAILAACALAHGGELAAQEAVQELEFRRVTLDQAIDIALSSNPTLEQTRTNIESAEFTRLNAYGSFLPNLSTSFGYGNSSSGRLDATGQGIVQTSYTAQVSASYDLFTGFRRFSDLKGARLGVVESQAAYRQSEFETVRTVKQNYFNTVAARDLVQVERDRVARQEEQLNFVEQQLELGRATRSDLLSSQVDLNNARLAQLNAENDARTTIFRLTEVVGVDQLIGPVAEATLEPTPFPYGRDDLLGMAFQSAPSIATAEASTDAAETQVSSARAAYLPSVSFNAGWAWANIEYPPENRSWSLSLRGSYPLFNGFSRETQVWQAQASVDRARSQERAAKLAVRSNLEAAYSTLQAAMAGIDLAAQSVELSTESLRVEQERYRLGLSTILDLRAAQISLSQAEVDLVSRKFDWQLALAEIEALLGRSLIDQ
jgi:TolC family type I secretion outer membrane protein